MGLIMSLPKDLKIHLWFRYLDNCSRVMLRSAYCRPGLPPDDDWIHLAAQHDYGYEMLMSVWGFIPPTKEVAEAAAYHGQMDIVRSIGDRWPTEMLYEGARGGHKVVVKELFEKLDRPNGTKLILEGAVAGDQFELLEFALTYKAVFEIDATYDRCMELVYIAVRTNSLKAFRIARKRLHESFFLFELMMPTNTDSTEVFDELWDTGMLICNNILKFRLPKPQQCSWFFEHCERVQKYHVLWCVEKYFNFPEYAEAWCKKYGPFSSVDVEELKINEEAQKWLRRNRFISDGCFCVFCTGECHPDSLPKFKKEYDMVIYMTERGLNPECFWKTKK